ncbi:MAG: hypothetical protein PVG39_30090, partial [Desulfobacteraceae bacterium]
MFRYKQVMAIAGAEARITRRLARYWVFLFLAYLVTFMFCALISYVHGFFSSYSGSLGAVSPRFQLSVTGLFYSVIFLVETIFLAFDIRARDKRERIIEVLDSRPFSNLELVFGRFVGVFLYTWIPIVLLAILLEIIGLIFCSLGLPVGEPIEVFSLFSFVFMMAVPALSFTIALVFFVTLLVRNRLAASVILLVLTGLSYGAMLGLPAVYAVLFDIIGIGAAGFPSEIAPRLATPEGWMQRFSVLFSTFSLLGFSAILHPRLDGGSRLKLTSGSIIIMICALSLTAAIFCKNSGTIENMETWKRAHSAFADEAVPDVKNIAGNIIVIPGKDLSLDLDITFGAPDDRPMKKVLFTLNPGQKVKNVSDSFGESISFTHENGLLQIILPQVLSSNEETTLHLAIKGLPNHEFAFLENAFNVLTLSKQESGDIGLFGLEPGIYRKDFVALMPGLRWLPISGPEKDRDDPRIRAVDFFNVDLKVELPSGWLVAGPGRRYRVAEINDRVCFRFTPSNPVPEVALVAARFKSRVMEVEGVTFEVLIHKKHIRNIEIFSDTGDLIGEWIGDHLREAREYGLDYPYNALTLVEVPIYLRTYSGGWRMDTAMAPPGMLLMREVSFPTVRFDLAFRKPEDYKNREGGVQRAKFERLKTFFINDFSGGNILSGSARNFFMYQTSARGPEGLALNYLMESLSNLLITDTKSYFSAHRFLESGTLGEIISTIIGAYISSPLRSTGIVDQTMGKNTSRPEVWDMALGIAIKDMDPWENPACTVDVLTLKAEGAARTILDILGREKTGQLLAFIRREHTGEYYSLKDVVDAGKILGYDLKDILYDWIESTNLPAFVCEEAKIYRIPDAKDGNPRYQMLYTIRNDEPVSGTFRFVYYYIGEGGKYSIIKGDPIRMTGKSIIRFGSVVSYPPAHAFLEPYLSLNRNSFMLTLNRLDQEKIQNREAFEGIEELPYNLSQDASIIIDDLDPGFNVIEEKKNNNLRIVGREDKEKSIDQGLPEASLNSIPDSWSRVVYTTSYGKNRHTFAVAGAGKGNKKAVFTTDINKAGKWELQIHIPFKPGIMPGKKWGKYYLIVTGNNGHQHEIEFNSNTASTGWNYVGCVDISEGVTTVAISNKTDGDFVAADAIRWLPYA